MGGSGATEGAVPYVENPDGYFVQQPVMRSVSPAPPGNLDWLARQLSTGHGGSSAGYRDHMAELFRPMTIPDYSSTRLPVSQGAAGTTPSPPGAQTTAAPDPKFLALLESLANLKNGR